MNNLKRILGVELKGYSLRERPWPLCSALGGKQRTGKQGSPNEFPKEKEKDQKPI